MNWLVYLLLTFHLVCNYLEVAGLDDCSEKVSEIKVACLEKSAVLCNLEKEHTVAQKEEKCRKCPVCLYDLNSCYVDMLEPMVYCREAQYTRQALLNQRRYFQNFRRNKSWL
ncbi:unnamed protein product [Dicrocoelium dendriticum]|nr:unnamed protein product [Dicrocoelium dendriticum]